MARALLLARKCAHQLQPRALLVLEQPDALERPVVGVVRLGAPERRRQHHLRAQHEAIEHQVMAEELPAPRFARRRLAEQAEDVAPFAHHRRPVHDVAEKAVELHHVARQLVAVRAHAHAQHRQHAVAQRLADLVEAQAVVLDVELGVLPVPPHVGAGRKARRLALLRRHRRQQRVDRLDHRLGRRALRPRREQIGDGLAVRGDAAERLVEHPIPLAEQLLGARACGARFRVRPRRRPGNLRVGRIRDERMIVVGAHALRSSVITSSRSSRTPPAARRSPPPRTRPAA